MALSTACDSQGLWGKWEAVAGGVSQALRVSLTSLPFLLALYKDGLRELVLAVLVLCLSIRIPLQGTP